MLELWQEMNAFPEVGRDSLSARFRAVDRMTKETNEDGK